MPAAPGPIAEDAILAAALRLTVEQGWSATSLRDIARAAGLSLAELYRRYPSKSALLAGFLRRIDAEMLAGEDEEDAAETELPRDRLFDVIMRRFDALAPHKEAVRVIHADLARDPAALAANRWANLRTLGWMMEAAGLASSGLRGAIRLRALGLVYARVLRVWLDDDAADLARTMAELDRRLRRAEGVLGLQRGRSRPEGAATGGWSPPDMDPGMDPGMDPAI